MGEVDADMVVRRVGGGVAAESACQTTMTTDYWRVRKY